MRLSKKVVSRTEELIYDGDYAGALALVDGLLAGSPQVPALHWYRSRCLMGLHRHDEARQCLAKVLEERPNFVPALMVRVKLARDTHERFDVEPLLRRVLVLEPERARAMYWLADTLLMRGDGHEREALALLDKSIALAPDLLKARNRRADFLLATAREIDASSEIVTDDKGQRSDKRKLEAALADFQFILQHKRTERAVMRAANALLRLGRKQEAAQLFDQMLEKIGGNDPKRDTLERLHPQTPPGHDAQSTASAWGGKLKKALKGTSPQATALRFAMQIYQAAFEPAPGLRKVDAKHLPPYQRKFADQCTKALQPLGFKCLDDAEAVHLSERDGQPALMRIFTHPTLGVFIARAYPPSLRQRLCGQLDTYVEGMAMLSNDVFVGVCRSSRDVLDFGGKAYRLNIVPPQAPLLEMVKRQRKHLGAAWKEFPGVHLIVPQDLTDLEEQWVRRNSAKKAHRQAIDYVTEEELRRLLGPQFEPLHAQVDALLEQLVQGRLP